MNTFMKSVKRGLEVYRDTAAAGIVVYGAILIGAYAASPKFREVVNSAVGEVAGMVKEKLAPVAEAETE